MAIQPIDLQTMYASLEKVSKMTSQKQQSVQLQSAIQQEELTKQIQEKAAAVEEAKMDEDELSHVKERKHHNSEGQDAEPHEEKQEEQNEEKLQIITDPSLGQHIDISG